MLVLSRKVGDELVLGDNVRVTVLEVCGNKVRLGFTAPANVPIHRQEVFDRLQAESERRDVPVQIANEGSGDDG